MARFAYLFERFPSFGQTFCYREVAELDRQNVAPPIFSIRKPKDEPPQDWDIRIVQRVHYLPSEKDLLEDVRRAAKKRKLGVEIVAALDQWGRRTDFLRLHQAVYIGMRLREMGVAVPGGVLTAPPQSGLTCRDDRDAPLFIEAGWAENT